MKFLILQKNERFQNDNKLVLESQADDPYQVTNKEDLAMFEQRTMVMRASLKQWKSLDKHCPLFSLKGRLCDDKRHTSKENYLTIKVLRETFWKTDEALEYFYRNDFL